jgi:hypothetical protein
MSDGIFKGMMSASVKDGTVVLGGYTSDFSVTLVGSSCSASVLPGVRGLSTVSLAPDSGQEAVVALCIRLGSRRKGDCITDLRGFLGLRWEGPKLIVDFGQYICPSYCLGQVTDSEDLMVTTHGQVFSTCRNEWIPGAEQYYEKKKQGMLAKRIRIVEDANLLCRYLVGQATFEELDLAASGDLRKAGQIRINGLQVEMCEMSNRLLLTLDRLIESDKELVSTRGWLTKAENALALERAEVRRLNRLCATQQAGLERTFGAKMKKRWDRIVSDWKR